MKQSTRELWAKQDQHKGDRLRLFRAVGATVDATNVLYPGSFVDVATSFVFPAVTYADLDKRAARFFADVEGVREIIASHERAPTESTVQFIHGDYNADLGLEPGSFDLLVSLYAGLVSEACTQYLRDGGMLLVNASHGDAALAAIDPRYQLAAVVMARDGNYRVSSSGLDDYLIPKSGNTPTVGDLHRTGRGIAYTKSAFAYIFERIR